MAENPPLLKIETSLGKDAFVVERFEGREGVSQLFQFEVHLYAAKGDIKLETLIGTGATVEMATHLREPRLFHGVIRECAEVGRDARGTFYHLTLVPWLWLLSLSTRCRIFQGQAVEEILRTVLAGHPVDFTFSDPAGPLPYCVQYEESDLAFASRMMEAHGISYSFVHQRGKHTLLLFDRRHKIESCEGTEKLSVQAEDRQREGVISTWHPWRRLSPLRQRLHTYNYKNPRADLSVVSSGEDQNGDARTLFETSAAYTDVSKGQALAQRLADAQLATQLEVVGGSSVRTLQPGFQFEIGYHERKAVIGTKYVLTEVVHKAKQAPGAGGSPYGNTFRCVPQSAPILPLRKTPWPRILSVQTATVVSPEKHEIKRDTLGCVLVRFHWDLAKERKKDALCWLRVAQAWAGNRYGVLFTPRVGQEVVVCFIDGNPDQPIIIGSAYNAKQPPPFAKATHSGIKTNSSQGGGGFNSLRFDDEKDKEQLFLHAARDLDLRVKAEGREYVGKDRHQIVKWNRHEEVGKNFFVKVGEKLVIDVGKSLTLKVGDNFIELTEQAIIIQGQKVKINCGGSAQTIPEPPKEAATDDPGAVDTPPRP